MRHGVPAPLMPTKIMMMTRAIAAASAATAICVDVKRFSFGLLEQGLKERAITRDLAWGVPVPLADGFRAIAAQLAEAGKRYA